MAGWKFYLDNNEVEEPIGWDGIEFTAIRMENHGIDQPFSTEVKFYDKGAKYIKSIFDQYYINQPIAITITSDVGYSGQDYQFDGFLNLAIYQEHNVCDTDSFEVTVGIIDDNFREDFKARQDVEIDLKNERDLNGSAIDPLTYDSIRMHKQELYLTAQAKNLSDKNMLLTTDPVTGNWDLMPWSANNLPTYFQNSDFKGQYGSTFNISDPNFNYFNVVFKNNASYQRTVDINFSIAGQFATNNLPLNTDTANFDIVLAVYDGLIFISETIVYSSANVTDGAGFSTFNTTASSTITVDPDYNLIAYIRWGTGGTIQYNVGNYPVPNNPIMLVDVYQLCFNLTELNEATYASTCNVLLIENCLRRIIYMLTGSDNKLLSDCFSQSGNGCYWNNALTNGLHIRQAATIVQMYAACQTTTPEDLPVMQLSWKQVFEGLDRIFCLGWSFEWTGTEWKIRVEPREYFYQNSISQTFNNVGEVDQMAQSEKLYNQIQLGFQDNWKNISVSGAWAIHTDRNYFIANRAMNENNTATLDIRSEIICEGYAIEFSRRLIDFWDDSGSSDRPNDFNLFLIWLNRNTIELEDVEDSAFVFPNETGAITFNSGEVSMPSSLITYSSSPALNLYNIYHSPARIAARWWKVLGMHTYGLATPVMQFASGQYQIQYTSQISDTLEPCLQYPSDQVVSESQDIEESILAMDYQYYLFKPISIQFTYPQSLCDFLTLSQDEQYRKVRLTSGGLDIQGFITEAKNKPEDSAGGTTTFTLLMSAQDALAGGAFNTGFDDGYD